MAEQDVFDITHVKKIITFTHIMQESINAHLAVGWKLLNINNIEEEERNLMTGEFEKVSKTLFTLGWPSSLGEPCVPEEMERQYEPPGEYPF